MEPRRDDQLIADLQALRPIPRPQFSAELDEHAAAGFPRRSRLRWSQFERLRALPRRRLLLPAGGLALAAIAVATVLVVSSEPESSDHVVAQAVEHSKAAGAARSFDGSGPYVGANRSSNGSAEVEAEAFIPMNKDVPGVHIRRQHQGGFSASFTPRHRAIERSAEITLAAEPEDVADDAARVFEAVHAHNGIVMRSSTQEGAAGEAGATFELLIPSAKLGNAMASFSEIDEVHSRHEATADITTPTLSAAELLKQSRARIDSLLAQLEAAETEEEREAIEAELRHERRHASRLAAQLDHLNRRADFSHVSLRIETGGGGESSGGGAWGIDDAFHDAGHLLTIAAAVTLIALAVLGPIALIALLTSLTHRAWLRRERRRALE